MATNETVHMMSPVPTKRSTPGYAKPLCPCHSVFRYFVSEDPAEVTCKRCLAALAREAESAKKATIQ